MLIKFNFLNTSKAGLFEGSFFWMGSQFDPLLLLFPLFIFQEELI